jgi:acetyl esterase/lipase
VPLPSSTVPRERHSYGRLPSQHGDLWRPDEPAASGARGYPVVVLLHGGFWRAMYTKRLMSSLASDVMGRGWVAWNLEYRRVGSFPGGGWPETFHDVATGIDHLRHLARTYPLDLSRVVAVGHSAGGHLALWAAGRSRLPPDAPGSLHAVGTASADGPVRLRGAIGQAPVSDLVEAAVLGLGQGAALRLLGGSPERHPGRYAAASPAALLPIGTSQVLVHGDADTAVPLSMSRHYVERAVAAGDDATLAALPGVGHFELIDPASSAWAVTVGRIERLLGR